MRTPGLLLTLPLLLGSCGRFPTVPNNTAPEQQPGTIARSAAGPSDLSGAARGDTSLATPDVHFVRVARLGDDVCVALVGRPPASGVHPMVVPFGQVGQGGYTFALKVDIGVPNTGSVESFFASPLDAHRVRLGFAPILLARPAPDLKPAVGYPTAIVAFHGDGSTWNFRFPASVLLSRGWTQIRWRLTLYSPIPGTPNSLTEYFRGWVDLSKPGQPSHGPRNEVQPARAELAPNLE